MTLMSRPFIARNMAKVEFPVKPFVKTFKLPSFHTVRSSECSSLSCPAAELIRMGFRRTNFVMSSHQKKALTV